MEQTPPMDFQGQDMMPNDDMGGGFQQPDMEQMPPMDDNGMENNNEFDTNVEQGVEADEEKDIKKFIQ